MLCGATKCFDIEDFFYNSSKWIFSGFAYITDNINDAITKKLLLYSWDAFTGLLCSKTIFNGTLTLHHFLWCIQISRVVNSKSSVLSVHY